MSIAQRLLLYAARFFAVCAVIIGLGSLLLGGLVGSLVCMDACPQRDARYIGGFEQPGYFSRGSVEMMTLAMPCLVLALIAFLLFLTYCVLTDQGGRALIALLVYLVPPIVAYVAFNYLYTQAAASLPVDSDGALLEGPLESFASQWYVGMGLFLCAWSFTLALLQWGVGRNRTQPLTSPAVR